tara:strand:- start:48250 stop:48552 length:303 start_codon:yes stop_codon:yes gene_type:complete
MRIALILVFERTTMLPRGRNPSLYQRFHDTYDLLYISSKMPHDVTGVKFAYAGVWTGRLKHAWFVFAPFPRIFAHNSVGTEAAKQEIINPQQKHIPNIAY